ncbi:NAD(P)H-binding protein [Pseudoalteromonas sp. SG45-5]|uniref:NAD(P)H-binding protein n=1 Tax=unclassified Pseudoalteromonas TaxID=194690 RepID=UPI0015F856C5|nr:MULTISPECIES: NAD(P)H-binding protein [unclassified Pseudoalteromonas]MBB1385459.1 NAD(P)H-binding protein [Pseudoalteromonas sp. SG45-5]MBB1393351.1 NAD(P)H-binding protein [Pseudoalteromonas sp. SG44-4]MBB1447050.1 NAD(P)H-binding protein [Pseudoalteromonas sp. SG41-6]
MTKTAILIGATGLVGNELLHKLLNSEHYTQVVTLSRRALPLTHAKLVNHVIDFEKLTQYVEFFKGDVLFSCLGTTRKQAGSTQAQRRVDVDYQFIAAQLAASNGVSHYCLVSSSGANAHSNSPYLKMKGELEQHIKALAFDKISIFQPSLLLGDREQFRVAEKIGSIILPVITQLPFLKRYKPITGKQVAQKILSVSLEQQAKLSYYVLDELFE